MLTEHRSLTAEEQKELEPILEKLSIRNREEIQRFVDTKLDKVYDVYLVKIEDKTRILKLLGERRFDKIKYDMYFTGKSFAVPEIYENVSVDGKFKVIILQMVVIQS